NVRQRPHFYITIEVTSKTKASATHSEETVVKPESNAITYMDLANFTAKDQLEMETGFNGDHNLWLQQLRYTAKTQNLSSCLACAAARPRLTTVPFPINPVNDVAGFECMMRLFSPEVITNCKTLSILFPAVSPTMPPTGVLSYPGNYTCLFGNSTNRHGKLGELPSNYCHDTITVGKIVPDCTGSDVWWICGPKKKLCPILPKEWSGTCAMIRLLLQITKVTLTTWDPGAPLGNMGTTAFPQPHPMALDMLLAEKGCVCKMFGETCCTFIPENTAPDGSITKALAGLTSLSNELAENSGIDTDPFTSWLDSIFGKYKAVFLSVAVSIAIFIALLSCCGCCCIPCLRSLSVRLIEAAIEKKDPQYGQQMPLLGPYVNLEDELLFHRT
uniref:Uncharacterized protein n=1 Tax=Cyclopterus lumpus TaxID=8103 RepID=A0A8C2WL57_CYCLU